MGRGRRPLGHRPFQAKDQRLQRELGALKTGGGGVVAPPLAARQRHPRRVREPVAWPAAARGVLTPPAIRKGKSARWPSARGGTLQLGLFGLGDSAGIGHVSRRASRWADRFVNAQFCRTSGRPAQRCSHSASFTPSASVPWLDPPPPRPVVGNPLRVSNDKYKHIMMDKSVSSSRFGDDSHFRFPVRLGEAEETCSEWGMPTMYNSRRKWHTGAGSLWRTLERRTVQITLNSQCFVLEFSV